MKRFVLATACVAALAIASSTAFAKPKKPAPPPPTNNPVAKYKIPWTDEARWTQLVVITNYAGKSWNDKFEAAQADLAKKGGGVVFFPAGTYQFKETLKLDSHIIIRGAKPPRITKARDGEYAPPTVFLFPKFEPKIKGKGTPRDSAFKGIEQKDPNKTTHCGMININMDQGHIKFGCDVYDGQQFADNFKTYGRNHIVYGCRLTHAAILDPRLPKQWQEPWQRWTHRHNAAIDIRAAANVLVANNQIPESGKDDFAMPGYKIRKGDANKGEIITRDDIVFRYDNRPGIYVNYGTVSGTPKTHPQCFAPGIDIRENYVFQYGCLAIGFSGNGTYCGSNIIRYKHNSYLPAYSGETDSHFTNNNRAIEARGWCWTIAYNDYEVYSNTQYTGQFNGHYGDNEGLMHESHCNCSIKDSKLLYNVGNRYLCMWRVPMDGLEIRGNIIRVTPGSQAGGQTAICVQGSVHRKKTLHPIKDVHIIDNITEGTGIRMHGENAGGNIIRGNRHIGPEPASIELTMEGVKVEDNTNYTVTDRLTYR
ncbi:hypothetical protein ACFLQU_00905 [Verrucomicrobiota bacterium]